MQEIQKIQQEQTKLSLRTGITDGLDLIGVTIEGMRERPGLSIVYFLAFAASIVMAQTHNDKLLTVSLVFDLLLPIVGVGINASITKCSLNHLGVPAVYPAGRKAFFAILTMSIICDTLWVIPQLLTVIIMAMVKKSVPTSIGLGLCAISGIIYAVPVLIFVTFASLTLIVFIAERTDAISALKRSFSLIGKNLFGSLLYLAPLFVVTLALPVVADSFFSLTRTEDVAPPMQTRIVSGLCELWCFTSWVLGALQTKLYVALKQHRSDNDEGQLVTLVE